MKKFFFISAFIISFNLSAFDKIVGGHEVDPTQVETSHIVSLGGGCAGSIIHEKWIVTAAHCGPVIGKIVTAGHINLKSKDRIKLEVKRGYIHPKYNEKTYSYDFALIELKYTYNLKNMEIKKIALLNPELAAKGAIAPGVMATATGWGSVREGGSSSNVLLSVELPIVSREAANALNAYKGLVDESMIPAGYADGKKDSCQGDSGGPLTIVGSDGNLILAGVISWGHGCAQPNRYGLYSNVSVGYEWIVKTMQASR